VGDPRADERGWEYRRRACDACGWTGVELRAIIDNDFAVVLTEVIEQARLAKAEAEARAMAEILASAARRHSPASSGSLEQNGCAIRIGSW
jgi:hypothetical protein